MPDRVVDASALAFAMTGRSESANALRARLRATRCHAPHLIDAELGNVLRKRARANAITPTQAKTALLTARSTVHYRYPHIGILAELAWEWRDNLSFYDALYVAVAARTDLPLVTGDRRLANAPGLACAVELITEEQ